MNRHRFLASALALLLAPTVHAQNQLTTTFAYDSFCLPNGGVYFDLHVTAPAITVTRMDLNLLGTGVVEVYTCASSYAGKATTASTWTLRGSGVVVGAAPGIPTKVQLPPFTLPQGTSGVAIRGLGVQQFFTIGNGSNQTWSTPHVTLHAGEATNLAFAPPVLAPRVVNAHIHYLVGAFVGIPPHQANANGFSRGFQFGAPSNFNIRQLALPPNAYQPGDTASYLVRINGAVAYRSIGNTGAVEPNLHVSLGDLVDVIANWTPAAAGSATAHVSGGAAGPFQSSIQGSVNTPLTPVAWSWDIGDPAWTPNGGTGAFLPGQSTFGRVLMTTEPGSVPASTTQIGHGCGLIAGSCYQQLNGSVFDLEGSALTFTPQPGGGYVVSRQGALLPVGSTSNPAVLPLLDDDQVTVPLTVGSFPGWPSLTIAANGVVSRGPANAAGKLIGIYEMLNAPETAFWHWHDFDPSIAGGGRVKIEQSAAATVITWDGVWDFVATTAQNASTVQFQLYADGRVTMAWGAVSDNQFFTNVIGYSPGGASPDPGATDYSALGANTLTLAPATAEAAGLSLVHVTAPIVGTQWELSTRDVPPAAVLGVDVLGLSDPGIDDLAVIGMPGCGLRCSLDLLSPWVPSGPMQQRSFFVPNVAALRGTDVFATSAVFMTPAPNAFGAITSNGIRGRIGDL